MFACIYRQSVSENDRGENAPSESLVDLAFMLTTGRGVERSEIPKQNYILYNKHSITFRIIEEYFRREEMVLNAVIELGSMEAIKELVKLGLGVSILAPWIARREIDEGSLVALSLLWVYVNVPLAFSVSVPCVGFVTFTAVRELFSGSVSLTSTLSLFNPTVPVASSAFSVAP